MKIGIFTENYYKGGLDTFLINLLNAWPDEKDEITLICNSSHPGLDTVAAKVRRPIRIMPYSRIFASTVAHGQSPRELSRFLFVRVFFVLVFRILQYPVLFPWYIFTLFLFFRRSDFDRLMVVNGGYPASLLCRCAAIAWYISGKSPLAIFNFHNSTARPPWNTYIIEYIIDSLVIRSVRKIVSVSKDCLGSLNRRKAFLGCTKLSYIYNGIEDPRKIQKIITATFESELPAERYCLMLATYESRKGHAYLLQAFKVVVKDYPDVRLRIYGHGKPHEMRRVADEVKRLELENNVTLGDFTPDTASLIAGASVLVVPSQAYESFGLTIIEAMAFGVPVVTTNVGGMPEVLGGSHAGFICSKDNSLEFAEAIKKILSDPALAAKLGRNGRQAFERRFTASKMAQQYESIIKVKEASSYGCR